MKFIELPIQGAYLIQPDKISDERGFFARTFDRERFAELGLSTDFPQHSVALNSQKWTLRGLHYQCEPYAETKLVRCVHGKIYDVILDIRQESASFMQWHAVTLDGVGLSTLYIPAGCAHGYLTLEKQSLVEYMMDVPYVPQAACGIRYDDERFGIDWPETPKVISDRDNDYPNFG
jgi:dTDP-4-dehydrorhamnose 3,5-epimerase